MGADVSAEREYTAKRAAEFERKYREMYGRDLSPEELLERYRMEKLKADQQRRLELTRGDQRSDEKSQPQQGNERRSRHQHHDDAKKRQQKNFDIILAAYEQSKRGEHRDKYDGRREKRSSREDRDYDGSRKDRSSRRRRSSRDRHRRRSSSGSTQENDRNRRSSRKTRSPEYRSASDKHRRRSRPSDSTDEKEVKGLRERRNAARNQPSSPKRRSTKDAKSDDASPVDEKKENKNGLRNRKRENRYDKSQKTRSDKDKDQKTKSLKSSLYRSAPDLALAERQHERRPWKQARGYFDEHRQHPQSWVQELAQGGSLSPPAPFMERRIVYSAPNGPSSVAEGLGYYPQNETIADVQPVPFSMHSMHKPSRLLSLNMSQQRYASSPMLSMNVNTKLPTESTSADCNSLARTSRPVIPSYEHVVQAHLPPGNYSTLPTRKLLASFTPSTNQTSPQYASSTLPRNYAPTPKPRNKGPAALRRRGDARPQLITTESAREDFESMLASDYEMSRTPRDGNYSEGHFHTLSDYRPNQEISVDDVAFRKQPEIADGVASSEESDAGLYGERVDMPREVSSTSLGYSSGFDVEMPEGICFDSEGKKANAGRIKRKEHARKKIKSSKADDEIASKNASVQHVQSRPPAASSRQKTSKISPRFLKSIDSVPSLESGRFAIPEPKETLRQRRTIAKPRHQSDIKKEQKLMVDRSTSPPRERILSSLTTNPWTSKGAKKDGRKKQRNKRIQYPPRDDNYEIIIMPSQKWLTKPKRSHNIGARTKPTEPDDQAPRLEGPPKRPIYILKEVFIEESLSSQSGSDISQVQSSALESSRSSAAKSNASANGFDSNQEKESAAPNFDWNSRFYSNSIKHNPAPSSPVTSTDSKRVPASASRPSSMVLGMSESIQASSYTEKDGKVFCLTRSRHGSPPPEIAEGSKEDTESGDDFKSQAWQDRQTDHVCGQFNAKEVGKWVLDCYAQDHKQKPRSESQCEPDPVPFPRAAFKSGKAPIPPVYGPLVNQQAVEADVEPGNLETLNFPEIHSGRSEESSKHDLSIGCRPRLSRAGDSSTKSCKDAEWDVGKVDKRRQRIPKQRTKVPEPEWKSTQYKAQLKQWNDSPATNVVLAEVCSVSDEDYLDLHQVSRISSSISSSIPSSPEQNGEGVNDYNSETTLSDSSGGVSFQKEKENNFDAPHSSTATERKDEEMTNSHFEATLSESSDKILPRTQNLKKDFDIVSNIPPSSNHNDAEVKDLDSESDVAKASDKIVAPVPSRNVQEVKDYVVNSTQLDPSSCEISSRRESLRKYVYIASPIPFSSNQYEANMKDWDSKSTLPQSHHALQAQKENLKEDLSINLLAASYANQYQMVQNDDFDHNTTSSESSDETMFKRKPDEINSNIDTLIFSSKDQYEKAKNFDSESTLPEPFNSAPIKTKLCDDSLISYPSNEREMKSFNSVSTSPKSSDELLSQRASLGGDICIGPLASKRDEKMLNPHPQIETAVNQKDKTCQDGSNKMDAPCRQSGEWGTKIPAQLYPDKDWRKIRDPKILQSTSLPAKHRNDDFTQQNSAVPTASMKEKAEQVWRSSLNRKSIEPSTLPLKTRSASISSEESTCFKPLTNPFQEIDVDEVDSIVMKVPGSGFWEKPGFEKELLETLEKTRQESRRETLEERKARILGIPREKSTDTKLSADSDEQKVKEQKSPSVGESLSEAPKKDLNAYINKLLIGVADVPSEARKTYFFANKDKKHIDPSNPTAVSSLQQNSCPPPDGLEREDKRSKNSYGEQYVSEV